MKKEEIIDKIRTDLETNVDEIRKSLEGYEAAGDIDENDTIDMEDFSQQDESKDIQRQLEIQLANAKDSLDRFNELAGGTTSLVKSGALVESDHNWFFIGVSFPAVKVGKKEVLGVSVESPAYSLMSGKEAGDGFKLGDHSYKILKVL